METFNNKVIEIFIANTVEFALKCILKYSLSLESGILITQWKYLTNMIRWLMYHLFLYILILEKKCTLGVVLIVVQQWHNLEGYKQMWPKLQYLGLQKANPVHVSIWFPHLGVFTICTPIYVVPFLFAAFHFASKQ